MLQNKREKIKKTKLVKFPLIPVKGEKHSRKKKPIKNKIINSISDVETSSYSSPSFIRAHINATLNTREPAVDYSSMHFWNSVEMYPRISSRTRGTSRAFNPSINLGAYQDISPIKKSEDKSKIKVTSYNSNGNTIFFPLADASLEGYTHNINVIISPTANCQLASLKNAYRLILSKKEDRDEIFKQIKTSCSKNQILIDINDVYEDKITKLFDKYLDLVIKTPYTNSNNNKMILCIYKWKKEKKEVEHPLDEFIF